MFNIIFKRALITSIFTFIFDFLFHLLLTRPMETLTYFVLKSLIAFFVATTLFSSDMFIKKTKQINYLIVLFGLISSTLMSVYYRAWELGEAYVLFGARAPDIIGINRDNLLLFSGTWWLGHALFFVSGVLIAIKFVRK